MRNADYLNLFESLELINANETSRHYQATEKGTDRQVSIVVFYKNLPNETNLSIQPVDLDFPGLATIYDIAEDSKYIMIPEEIVGKGSLLNSLLPNPVLSELKVSRIAKCVLQSLKFLHDNGIIDRNLSFNNILVSNDPTFPYKLKDYMLSKLFDAMKSNDSFAYENFAAPEVAEGRPYDGSCDVFSLGIMLHVMLTGKAPFPIEVIKDTSLTNNFKVNCEEGVWQKISDDAKEIIKSMIVLNPAERAKIEDLLEKPWINGKCSDEDIVDAVPDLQLFLMGYRLRCAMGAAKTAAFFKNFIKVSEKDDI